MRKMFFTLFAALCCSTLFAQEAWVQKASLPEHRTNATGGIIGNAIYVAGGRHFGGGYTDFGITNTLLAYDVTTNAWSTRAPMLTAREHTASAVVNGKLYVIGGVKHTGLPWPNDYEQTCTENEVYDPATNSWSTLAPMPTGRNLFSATVIDNKIYCMFGYANLVNPVPVEVYDPATNLWTTLPVSTTNLQTRAGVTMNNRAHVAGGFHYDFYSDSCYILDPVTNTFSQGPRMPEGRKEGQTVYLNHRMYAMSGDEPGPANITNYIFDSATNEWYIGMPMPYSYSIWNAVAVAAPNGKIYFIGGRNADSFAYRRVYEYTPGPLTIGAITGSRTMCVGASTDLDNITTGGVWSIAPTSVATVNATTGVVAGIAGGTATVTYTAGANSTTATVTVNGLPTVFNVLGTANICAGSGCSNVTLSSSQTGVNYQVYKNGIATGSPMAGTGAALALATECATGRNTYSVVATRVSTGCSAAMNGTAVVSKSRALTSLMQPTGRCNGAPTPPAYMPYTVAGFKYYLWRSYPSGSGLDPIYADSVIGTGGAVSFSFNYSSMPPSPGVMYKIVAIDTIGLCGGDVTAQWDASLNSRYPLVTTYPNFHSLCSGTNRIMGDVSDRSIMPGTVAETVTWQWLSSDPSIVSLGYHATSDELDTVKPMNAGVVTLTLQLSNTCRSEHVATVNATPDGDFTVNDSTQFLTGNNFVFNALATGAGVAHQWTYGDGVTTSYVPANVTASHTYSLSAAYTVTHKAIVAGCPEVTASKNMYVYSDGSSLTPIAGPFEVCAGSTVTLTNATSGGTWSIAPASLVGTVNATTGVFGGLSAGNVVVSYTMPDMTYVTRTMSVHATPGTIGGPSTVCASTTIQLTNSLSGGTWSEASAFLSVNSSTGVVTGGGAGVGTVTYMMPTGCYTTTTITVNANTTAYTITGGGSYCVGGTCPSIGLSNSSTSATYQLYIGATAIGSPVAGTGSAFSFGPQCTGGVYSVLATPTPTGCTRAMSSPKTVTANALPDAGYTVNDNDQPLAGNNFVFTSNVTTGTHTWAFGDAASASIANPSHSYTAAGTYTVTHTLNNGTCAGSSSQTMTVTADAFAGITGSRVGFENVCIGTPTDLYHSTPGGVWSIAPATAATIHSSTGVVTGIAPGTGIVTYTVGSNSVTVTLTVHALTSAAFTVNDLTQELTGNNFVFTPTGDTTGIAYNWAFGDATTYAGALASHSYTTVNIFDVVMSLTVTATGCTNSSMQQVCVLSDGVGGGGGDGGLESESLGGLVSKVDFERIKKSIDKHTDYTKTAIFTKTSAEGPASKGTQGSTSRLQDMVPASLNATTVPMITTPTQLTAITKAVDVFALDYVSGTTPKAVVLGITTLDKPYTHTKSICDRFRGGTLLYIEAIKIKGYDFIRFALRQPDGSLEFCIAFDAGKSAGRNSFHLQTSWLLSQYKGDDSVFNFQAWATDPENTAALVGSILDNLNGIMPVEQVDTAFAVPVAYMAAGKRNKNSLDIKVTNNTPIASAEIRFDERVNEFANINELSIPLTLKQGKDNVVSIPIGDGYEYPGSLYLNGQLVDAVYMADGNWSLDYDNTYTEVSKFTVTNDPGRIYIDNEYPLYRGLHVKGTSTDYLMAYKFIASGNEPVDMSGHRTLKFTAKGSGKMNVVLVKDGITKWAEQYSTTVTLDPAGKEYAISFADFVSTKHGSLKADDLTAVVFSCDLSGAGEGFDFQASRIAFSPEDVPSTKHWRSKSLSLSPNPSSGVVTLKFNSEYNTEYDLALVDVSGRVVYKQKVHAAQGENSVTVTLPSQLRRPALYTISIGNEDVTYSATKLSITE